MPGTGSYTRGEQPRSVPDPLAGLYSSMVAQQRAYNARQEAELEQRRRGVVSAASSAAPPRAGAGAPLADRMYRPPAGDIAELRRRQAEFKRTEHALARENAWMAAPALAPVAAVAGLEAAGAIASRLAPAAIERAPLQFVERDPHLRVGDNWAARAGRRAHKWLENTIESKPEWEYEPKVPRAGGRPLKPDVGTPPRNPLKPGKRYYLELKPNTPTGRAAGARAVKRYEGATRGKARVIYYDPKGFI